MATIPTPSLFPNVPIQRDTPADSLPPNAAAGLSGIARLAADSPLAGARRGVEYFQIPVRSILNHCDSERVPFKLTINPYRGCEFGCVYCYARYTHEYMELDGGDFERKIYAKANAGPIVSRDLAREDVIGEHIAIGTATDPYQPAEREFGVTREILEKFALREGLQFSITTKSNQVTRDLDLLKRIAERSAVSVNVTIVTPRTRLARLLEPRAPRPDLRFAAVRALHEAGIRAGVFVMPVLPGLTDRDEDLELLACAAKDAGAQWLVGGALHLMPAPKKVFLPFIQQKFPRLAARYLQWYGRAAYAPEKYRQEISEKFSRLRERYGLGTRPIAPARLPAVAQLGLPLEMACGD